MTVVIGFVLGMLVTLVVTAGVFVMVGWTLTRSAESVVSSVGGSLREAMVAMVGTVLSPPPVAGGSDGGGLEQEVMFDPGAGPETDSEGSVVGGMSMGEPWYLGDPRGEG